YFIASCLHCSMLQWKFFRSRRVAIGWFLLMTILFFIPGSSIPKQNWLTHIQFDKIVHIGLFAVLVFLWRSAFHYSEKHYNALLIMVSGFYGLLIEILQGFAVPNRDFDLYDLVADVAGSFLGILVWMRVYKKNRPL
ncbi:MAG: VanZ family protein, partial [Flavitalea sp.]